MEHTQKSDWIDRLPDDLHEQLSTQHWKTITMGASGTQVFHVKDGYLKISTRSAPISLQAEKERLQWLYGRLPVPQVYYYNTDATHEYLLLSEIPGIMSCDPIFKDHMPELIHLLAEALHMLHAVDISDCPFNSRLQRRLTRLRRTLNTRAANDRHTEMQEIRKRYEHIVRSRPASEDLVLTHGDFCLPNIIIDLQHKQISGFIDWELAGIADRHVDLERTSWSLAYNFDASWIPALFAAYGSEHVDQQKIKFYEQLEDIRYLLDLIP